MARTEPLPHVRTESTAGSGNLRRAVKWLAFALAWLFAAPLILLTRAEEGLGETDRVYSASKEGLAAIPGLPGQYLRVAFYSSVCRAVSREACFAFGSMVSSRSASIGAGTVIGAGSIVGPVSIGRDVMIGARVSVFSDRFEHGYPHERARGHVRGVQSETVIVGDTCWIGENAVVMASIGPRCTVAAGAVVFREAAAGETLIGNPARKSNL